MRGFFLLTCSILIILLDALHHVRRIQNQSAKLQGRFDALREDFRALNADIAAKEDRQKARGQGAPCR
jgi:hypothetical protein